MPTPGRGFAPDSGLVCPAAQSKEKGAETGQGEDGGPAPAHRNAGCCVGLRAFPGPPASSHMFKHTLPTLQCEWPGLSPSLASLVPRKVLTDRRQCGEEIAHAVLCRKRKVFNTSLRGLRNP